MKKVLIFTLSLMYAANAYQQFPVYTPIFIFLDNPKTHSKDTQTTYKEYAKHNTTLLNDAFCTTEELIAFQQQQKEKGEKEDQELIKDLWFGCSSLFFIFLLKKIFQ